MLLKAVPKVYIHEMEDPVLGYAKVSTKQLLKHLDDNYGKVTARDLARNTNQMNQQWTSEQPIQNLWTQIQRARTYGAPYDPITEQTAMRAAVSNLRNTGLFTDDIKNWENKPLADQTWLTLKLHFNQANNHRLENPTVADAGYTAATKESDKENAKKRTGEPLTHWKYCWSHGLQKSHDSTNCMYPKTGHVNTATLDDRHNGAMVIYAGNSGRNNVNRRGRGTPLTTQQTPPVQA